MASKNVLVTIEELLLYWHVKQGINSRVSNWVPFFYATLHNELCSSKKVSNMAASHEYPGITWSVVGQVYWELLNELKLHIL